MGRTKLTEPRKLQKRYKIYEGNRCVLVIIPRKIREDAKVGAGDYVSFRYDEETDEIVLRPQRVRI